jgi:hypothetical protein
MKRLAWFTGLAWAVAFAQTAYATHIAVGNSLSVTGDIHSSAVTPDTASSNPFTIVDQTAVNSESSAPVASSASSATASSAAPKTSARHTAATAGATASASSTPTAVSSGSTGATAHVSTSPSTPVPTALASLAPVLASLTPTSGNLPSTSASRHQPYDPAPVNNNPDPGTPPGLQVFNPTPASPGAGSPASVPDGGATSALLGIGFLGTAVMKKKFAK